MTMLRKLIAAASFALLGVLPIAAKADSFQVVVACGAQSIPIPNTLGTLFMDQTGNLCTNASGGGGGNVNITGINGSTPGPTVPLYVQPSTASPGQPTTANSSSVVPASDSPPWLVNGSIAAGSTETGNPVLSGGDYNTTKPTLSAGQRGAAQYGQRGSGIVQLAAPDSASAITFVGGGADGATNGFTAYTQDSRNSIFNGTTWDRYRSINGALPAGTGTAATAIAATSAAAGALTHLSSSSNTAVAFSAKATAGNLYGFNCTAVAGGAAGYCIAYNGTSAPGTGALTAANVLDFCFFDTTARGCTLSRIPMYVNYSAGIQILISSAATPYTYTTGTDTAAITVDFQ
jgi:hypothetical protein